MQRYRPQKRRIYLTNLNYLTMQEATKSMAFWLDGVTDHQKNGPIVARIAGDC
jgi:hypothetical protein